MRVAGSGVKKKIQTSRHSKNQCFVMHWKVAELKCNRRWGGGYFWSIQKYGIQGNPINS